MPVHTEFVSGIVSAVQELYGRGKVTAEAYAEVIDGINRDDITPQGILRALNPAAGLMFSSWGALRENILEIGGDTMPLGVGYGGYSTYTDYPEIEADFPSWGGSLPGFGGGIYGATAQAVGGVGVTAAWTFIRQIAGNAARLTREQWNRLPEWVKNAIVAAGIILPEVGDIPIPGRNGGTDIVPYQPGQILPVSPGTAGLMQGAQVVGSWNTNPENPARGVWFYRLADGKLAVQNLKGRWKVWRPKRPIVLYATGATDLKTMLRADKALNKQAKELRKVLDRRAPKRPALSAGHKHARAVENIVNV